MQKHFGHIEFYIAVILLAEYINLNVEDSFPLFPFSIIFKLGLLSIIL